MKKLPFIFLILLALVVALVLLLPQLVPMETITAKVREQVKQATGRDLSFAGATFVFFPNIGIKITGATFSNPVWAKERNMLALDEADIALALKPLLQRRVEIKRFVLNAPVIHLEVSPDGKRSWDFSKNKVQPTGAAGNAAGMADGFELKFSQAKMSKGKLTFLDRQKGSRVVIEDINMAVSWADPKSALQIEGALTYQGKRVDLAADLEKPLDLMRGGVSPGHVALQAAGASVKGALLAGKTEIALKGADLAFDDVRAKGNVRVNFAGKPEIFARLSMDKLDLDRFAGATSKPSGDSGAGGEAAPLDLSGLSAANADLELKTEGFSFKGADVGPGVLTLVLQDGKLRLKSSEASLFDGKFRSDLTLSALSGLAFNFTMEGVQAGPVLESFANFNKLSGTTDARVSVTSSGNSQKALIANLAGEGAVVFKNGALEGIDLVNIAKLVQKRLTDVGVGAGKTDFVELGGTFTISRGIVSNSDLKMKGPLLQATGQGTVDLPQQYVRYRVLPVLTASSAVEGAAGLAIPVDIAGPFSNIKVKPDFASVIADVINNPEAAKQTLKDVKAQGKAIGQSLKMLKKDPAGALQNFLGGGGLLGAPVEPPPEPAPPAPALPEPSASPAPAP